jgi:hypothetical protein
MIKSFKQYIEEANADDYVAPKDSEKEATEYEPRSKGEKGFKDQHKVEKKKHPVAGDHQFNGDRKEVKK